jgi:UPF0176 protein
MVFADKNHSPNQLFTINYKYLIFAPHLTLFAAVSMNVMTKYNTLLYYCYATITDGEQFAADHLNFCKSLGLTGRIIVANEGLNGTVSGTAESCRTYMDTVHADERFAGIDFKIDEVVEPSFVKMHVRYKSEIVHSGLRDPNMINPQKQTGKAPASQRIFGHERPR